MIADRWLADDVTVQQNVSKMLNVAMNVIWWPDNVLCRQSRSRIDKAVISQSE